MTRSRLLAAFALFGALGGGAAAQASAQNQTPVSPHGDLATPCAQCHTATSWRPARISADFTHPSRFVLAGAHAATQCSSCHRSLVFRDVATTCVGCHADVHRGELGLDCARCHTPRSFIDRSSMARAHQGSRFPLTGVHAATDCTSCHTPTAQGQMRFVNRPTQCESCHLAEAIVVKDPDHQAAGFTRQCERCHSPTVWSRARFDHATTAFALTGAHVRLTCQQCHADRVYDGKPSDCVSCHRTDYTGTTDPSHVAAAFPTTCASCHTTATWSGGRFDHDASFFPIYSGAHRGRWEACSTCHTSQTSFAVFTCITCHTQSESDGHHRGVNGYRYESQACYTCHKNGKSP